MTRSFVTADETSVRSVNRRVVARDTTDISAQDNSTTRCQPGRRNYHEDTNRRSLQSNLYFLCSLISNPTNLEDSTEATTTDVLLMEKLKVQPRRKGWSRN